MNSGPQRSDALDAGGIYERAGRVEAALLVPSDLPDAALFVEDILPRWLRFDREASSGAGMNPEFVGR